MSRNGVITLTYLANVGIIMRNGGAVLSFARGSYLIMVS